MDEPLIFLPEEPPESAGVIPLDPMAASIKARKLDLFWRIMIGIGVGTLCFYEANELAAIVAFAYVYFFVPKLASDELTLQSGRTARGVTTRFTRASHGNNYGKTVMDVTYTCCTNDPNSPELHREFNEVCAMVLRSCNYRKLTAAEITAELPKNQSFLTLHLLATAARSAEFEKVGDYWQEILIP
jgi:hypothetical protein